jgi:acetate kinase
MAVQGHNRGLGLKPDKRQGDTRVRPVLAINAGSSSIKFAAFAVDANGPDYLLFRGLIDDKSEVPSLSVKDDHGRLLEKRSFAYGASQHDLVASMLDWIEAHLEANTLLGVGHRVVHGGRAFVEPVRIDENVVDALVKLTPLAPLHQSRSLEPIQALLKLRPSLPQVACFDTAFHHGLAPVVSRYGLPRTFETEGIRKFGFHGLSYEFIAARLEELDPSGTEQRTIVAHLGNGASLCAMRGSKSLDTTMGFTALDGLVMGTRCGALDPGIVLYLLKAHGLSSDEVEDILYHRSGLLGVSELSADMRELSASRDPRARDAIDLFTFRIARETAALCATMGGLDRLVFTGGIGEHAANIRAEVCERLAWLGIALDNEPRSDDATQRLSSQDSRVTVLIIPTDEEQQIVRHVVRVLH